MKNFKFLLTLQVQVRFYLRNINKLLEVIEIPNYLKKTIIDSNIRFLSNK